MLGSMIRDSMHILAYIGLDGSDSAFVRSTEVKRTQSSLQCKTGGRSIEVPSPL